MEENKNSNKGFITLTVVFEAMSLNRDEGMGNIQSLHLLTRGDGNVYSFMSRQALTYSIRKFLVESKVWKETGVGGDGDVSQYSGNISDFEEIDLFGYMRTEGKKEDKKGKSEVRPAAVTFTHAISLEPYGGDIAFYANHEMIRRRGVENPNPYNRQEHKSLYKYSIVIDLNRVSKKDEKNENQNCKKASLRITQLLDSVGSLHHQIAAYREPLYPLFIAAAHIKYGSPIFHNYVELSMKKDEKNKLNAALFEKGLKHANEISKNVGKKAVWAILDGSGDLHLVMNKESVNNNNKKDVPMDVINDVKSWVKKIYNEEHQ